MIHPHAQKAESWKQWLALYLGYLSKLLVYSSRYKNKINYSLWIRCKHKLAMSYMSVISALRRLRLEDY